MFNSNKERKAYWELMTTENDKVEIEKAIATLKPDAQKVIRLYYENNLSFTEITTVINKSISTVRSRHNRGIYLLFRYFNPRIIETV